MADAPNNTTLSHVNVPPAQTWNYLRINDTALTVPTPVLKGEVVARLPHVFDAVETGLGADAVKWIELTAGDAHYVEVKRNTTQTIVCDVDADAATPRERAKDTGIMVREDASARVVIVSHGSRVAAGEAESAEPQSVTSANLVRIVAEKNAHVQVVEVISLADSSQHLQGVGIDAAQDADVEVRQYALGGGKVAMGLTANLAGKAARLELTNRYLVGGEQTLDINHVVRQRGVNTVSNLAASGILSGRARKTLRETIDLIHGAKGAKGSELETVLVTSDDIVNKTLPVVLCDEEDVAGNHGASIGSISPEQLAYLAGRGVSEDEATALFSRAIFDDALIHADEASARSAVLTAAAAVLGSDVAADIADTLGIQADGASDTTSTQEVAE